MKVRVAGEGDDGAVAQGPDPAHAREDPVRRQALQRARRPDQDGQGRSLAKSARKALRRSRTLKATLSATGTDTSGAAIAARQAVKLTR